MSEPIDFDCPTCSAKAGHACSLIWNHVARTALAGRGWHLARGMIDPRDARIAALEKAEAESVHWARLVSDGIDQLKVALSEALDLADIWIGSDGPFDRDYKADRVTSARLRDLVRVKPVKSPNPRDAEAEVSAMRAAVLAEAEQLDSDEVACGPRTVAERLRKIVSGR